MPAAAATVPAMPRKPRPGPAKGAPNAGRPKRPGQVVVQVRASEQAFAAFDDACEQLFHACRTDVMRWWIEDAAAGRVVLTGVAANLGADAVVLKLTMPGEVAALLRQAAEVGHCTSSDVIREALVVVPKGGFVPEHLRRLVGARP